MNETAKSAESALKRNYPRALRALRIGYFLVIGLLVGEIGVRVATYVGWKRSLSEFAEIERRHDQSRAFYPAMTIGAVLGDASRFPAAIPQNDGPPRIVPFGELTTNDFKTPLPAANAPAGTVRIVFAGGSTTFDGYPESVGALFAKDGLKGRVEAINLGVPASNTATTLISMRRFLPTLKPQIVVLYHGFNDAVYYRARAEASRRLHEENAAESDPAIDVRAPSHGLGYWLFGSNSKADWAMDLEGPTKNYEEMSELGKELGFSLYLSTFAAPSYQTIDAVEKRYFEAEIRHLWPPLGQTSRYEADLAAYNGRVREIAGRLSEGLIDVADGVHGGRSVFRDNCHLNENGREVHARIVHDALLPAVRRILDKEEQPR